MIIHSILIAKFTEDLLHKIYRSFTCPNYPITIKREKVITWYVCLIGALQAWQRKWSGCQRRFNAITASSPSDVLQRAHIRRSPGCGAYPTPWLIVESPISPWFNIQPSDSSNNFKIILCVWFDEEILRPKYANFSF